jgi:hypothetical protein
MMSCYRVRRTLAAYCDGAVSLEQGREVRLHLAGCPSCTSLYKQFARARAALRALPVLTPPGDLLTRLRVLASRESARRLSPAWLPYLWSDWAPRARVWASGMMRPLALPMAGGLLSAIFLFGLLAPNFALHENPNIADVPTTLSTEAAFVGMGPFNLPDDLVTVIAVVDGQGRMVDYSTPDGQSWAQDPEAKRIIENALLFTKFSPGTTFGKPAYARVRITLRRSEIDVRG